jgi:peptidylprolyl isomerase
MTLVHRSSFLYDLSRVAFTGYNSSFTGHRSEDNSLPQSRRRKVKGRSHSAKKSAPKSGSNKTVRIIVLVILAALIVAAVLYLLNSSSKPSSTASNAPTALPTSLPEFDNATTTDSGLKYIDEVVGTGETPKTNQDVTVHYTGTLTNGVKFDSSRDRGEPYTFKLGVVPMIKGWDEAIRSMKVGGRRKLLVPPALGYGARGNGPSIPPNATLVFDIELLGVK